MKLRDKPYFWVTWLTGLLTGADSCYWKVWLKGHYQDVKKTARDFDMAKWNEDHTVLLNKVRREYDGKAKVVLTEGQTAWKIEGNTAIVAGKMDLLTMSPNLVIDAKSGKQKDAHIAQIKIYLLAITLGAVPAAKKGKYTGLLVYPDDQEIKVPEYDDPFKQRFYDLVKQLADPNEPVATPSYLECKFCDVADCELRIKEEPKAVTTDQF